MKALIKAVLLILLFSGCSEQPLTETQIMQGKAREWVQLNPGMATYLTSEGVDPDFSSLTLKQGGGELLILSNTQTVPGKPQIKLGLGFYIVNKAVFNAFMVRVERLPNQLQQIDHIDTTGEVFNRMEYNDVQNLFTKLELGHVPTGGRKKCSPQTLDCIDVVYTFSQWVNETVTIGSVISPQAVLEAVAGCAAL